MVSGVGDVTRDETGTALRESTVEYAVAREGGSKGADGGETRDVTVAARGSRNSEAATGLGD